MPLCEKDKIKGSINDSIYGGPDISLELPKYKIPESQSPPRAIAQLIEDELLLDGNARQNLATFCQTYGEPELHRIMDISMNKNMIDKDEYPQTAAIEERCVHIISDLWNSPDSTNAIGTSTVGSSEACMLGGMAMLHRWKAKRKEQGKKTCNPNLVSGPVQVCWEKFARYWDVELRQVPMEKGKEYMSPKSMVPYIDDNTIGIVATLGLTFTGRYEPIEEISETLDVLEKEKGISLDIHVDAASGGFLAPFCAPDLIWDFRLERVKSISTSGHKFGLAPLGNGWIIWRDKKDLPENLIFHVNYLGGDMAVFQLNFSRPAGAVIAEYYQLLRLGREGFKKIHMNCYETANYLAREMDKLEIFEVVYRGDPYMGLPALTWRLKNPEEVGFNLYDFSDKLRTRGWQVPAYALPPEREKDVVQRVLVKQGFGLDLAGLFMEDIKRTVNYFSSHGVVNSLTEEEAGGFNHAG